MDKKGEMDSLQPNLEGADRARSSEERARARMCVCAVYLCICMIAVLMLLFFPALLQRSTSKYKSAP